MSNKKKTKTVAHLITPLLKKKNKSEMWYKKPTLGINKVGSSNKKKLPFEAELNVEGGKVGRAFGTKNACEDAEVIRISQEVLLSV